MVISMAPGISKIYMYEAGPSGIWHDILNRMATDNTCKQLSCSWYIPNGSMDTVADGIFQQMAAQGQSFFNASGDDDAFCGLIDFPGDTPYITQVGGTFLTNSAPGGSYVVERAWNRNNGIGSGGGISTQYSIPTWQQGINMIVNNGSTAMRNVPDVALTADGVYVRADGLDKNVGGTSAAAPLWAGFFALVKERAGERGLVAARGFGWPAARTTWRRPTRRHSARAVPTSQTMRSTSSATWTIRGTSRCRCWPTAMATSSTSASATARSSAGIRRSSRRPRRRS